MDEEQQMEEWMDRNRLRGTGEKGKDINPVEDKVLYCMFNHCRLLIACLIRQYKDLQQ